MKNKILKQAGIVIIIAVALFISKNSPVDVMERGADTILGYMEVNYTADTFRSIADRGKAAAVSATSKVSEAVGAIAGRPVYSDPIDSEFSGNEASVYAVGGGQVTETGENDEIGKYIRITHGDYGESLYGNLKSVNVEAPSRVKKGQIIGIYEKSEDREFYYSFREFD